jgi:hypothetical protein
MPSYIASFCVFAILLQACSTFSGKSFVPVLAGYNEQAKEVYVLKKTLLEVSGIVYLGNDSMAAINDEKGELFMVDLKDNSSTKYQFKGKDDYEDMVKTDSFYYVVESDGDILEITYPPNVKATSYDYPENEKKTEFESLVWYKKLNKLVLISKDERDRMGGITAYSFDLATKLFDTTAFFNISLRDIFTKLQNYSADCKPSAAALHPITNQLYIIASVGKLLLICTADGKLQKLYKLNPAQFPQPEGISFADNGDMYISNEGLDGKATILKFPYSGRK